MKRRHLRADAIRFCEDVRRRRPETAFSADFIAGFPTESETMFEASLRLIEECGLARAHVFPFSPRPGAPAARLPQIATEITRERAARFREASNRAWSRHLGGKVGKTLDVLMERGGVGRAEDFTPVKMEGIAPGALSVAFIESSDGRELKGLALP
jgi:threonylcarbamoyladenosine tRNA methylthiotransferase MtaB